MKFMRGSHSGFALACRASHRGSIPLPRCLFSLVVTNRKFYKEHIFRNIMESERTNYNIEYRITGGRIKPPEGPCDSLGMDLAPYGALNPHAPVLFEGVIRARNPVEQDRRINLVGGYIREIDSIGDFDPERIFSLLEEDSEVHKD